VAETLVPGTSVAVVARAHGVNANQVFTWRKLYQAGLLGSTNPASTSEVSTSCVRLLPVAVTAEIEREPEQLVPSVSRQPDVVRELPAMTSPGSIELTFGKAQIRIVGQVDAGTLRMVLECLRR
jgi:transposase